jgi:hypothetical protein
MNPIVSDSNFDELIKLFNENNTDNQKLEKSVNNTVNSLGENCKIKEISNEKIRMVFESASVWILKNFSNPLLTSVINFISVALYRLDYKVEIKKEGIIYIYSRNNWNLGT